MKRGKCPVCARPRRVLYHGVMCRSCTLNAEMKARGGKGEKLI